MGYINWQDENKTVPPRELRLTDLGVAGAAMAEQIIAEVVKERDAAIARAEAAEAELEALKAANEWRPATEPPENGTEVHIMFEARYSRDGFWDTDGYAFSATYPKGWRPLPPQE